MNKKKIRKVISLECSQCKINKHNVGISSYRTIKNKQNTPKRLELQKFCKYCKHHNMFKEKK
jgi:large subunit ribosomal protein L33